MNNFVIKTEEYSGPIDALLMMVEEKKLHINSISLSTIADDFISFVASLDKKNVDNISDFLYIVSILLLLKSKSLLNIIELSKKDDDIDVYILEKQLHCYKTIKTETIKNEKLFEKKSIFLKKPAKKKVEFLPDSHTTLVSIKESALYCDKKAKDYLNVIPTKSVGSVFSIEDKMKKIQSNLTSAQSIIFNVDVTSGKKDFLVTFLAVLELVKIGNIDFEQPSLFSEIKLQSI